MKKRILILVMFFALFTGCSRLPREFSWADYKGTYVGNNSAVGTILNKLPANEYLTGFSLKTNQPPYEITIAYKDFQYTDVKIGKKEEKQVSQETVLKGNAVVLFSLIENVDAIHFDLEDHNVISFSRHELVGEFEDFDQFIQNDSSMQKLYKATN
ncbi:MAG: DUF4825 domain-containing protein [Turicibacter sp.]|jgi:hypothetical protein|uniref:DUF4825 domain-containing protein n=1 Tax=Turicibacter faecis TaxID=2963365 RepID=A0ABM8IIQ0_9FIRM|nr:MULTISPECIES: DUF4825 domain-containing protein [unclassified Turicibacter]MCI8700755.1 DUF4825 domain-containing protein [Turicibacter sp.]BEH91109.1 hypothetical protein T23_12110 [Turicibacter sp. TC023]MCU7204202.1 DUF4825 domain-containing protein [Turicibacter sp. TA25]MCU7209417.1 DUF4825 domain-containing protein [Turicibacter sp. 1E2]NCE78428.1 DUF4825 domain-containing protein [Turicibacter sp. TS3]